jgi:hypothetical protein
MDLVPIFCNYTVKSCLLPLREIQDELVRLYFRNIHPMFPVVDEVYYTELHRRFKNREQFMRPPDFVIYQAILTAGFGVSKGFLGYHLMRH